jgi:D-hexose-6-phosphate mutarotase
MSDLISALNIRHAIPGTASIVEGANGLPKIHISTPQASAEIYLHGAHLTSWRPAAPDGKAQEDVLFLSRRSNFAPGKAIRGGVPICFPWFGPKSLGPNSVQKAGDPPAPQHGFARTTEWTLESITREQNEITVTLSLTSTETTLQSWPHPFRADYRVTIGQHLTLALTVTNTGDAPLTFTEALHTYHHTGDAAQVRISGLDGIHYLDNREKLREKLQQGDITFPTPTDNIYLDTTGSVVLHDPTLGRNVTVDKQHSATTVVWNPGSEGASALADMADEEWQYFACIEASNVHAFAISLAPGQTHTMTAILRSQPLA